MEVSLEPAVSSINNLVLLKIFSNFSQDLPAYQENQLYSFNTRLNRRGLNKERDMSTHSVPPGWYSDPDGKPAEKYWDGNAWTKETRPLSIIPNKSAPIPKKVGIDGNERVLFAILAVALILGMFLVPL
ncbi:MAG: hypothetical protein ABS08_01920 [Actinobacteria bacterium BACL4 MAG-120507-bin0]|jgi:hypothetical protein|nr:MAG: hypothetical protein ABS00_03135 [Actinobacteria bacterium BACL2 MAG-120920-bin34]KRO92779.1 MAG: hypothetical protein ABS08_01920 [Actinobacteria bacterium BACL4 MAG-120507-bin0]